MGGLLASPLLREKIMASGGVRVIPDILRTRGFGGIAGLYLPVGAVFTNPIRIISIKNLTDQALFFSYDGVNDNEILPSESGLVLDFTANSTSCIFPFIASGTTVYVRYGAVAPTIGSVAVSAYYCIGD
jgi:hypothetical protein